jgi:hypothetical protein
MRLVLLDKVVLQQKRLLFGGHDRILDVNDIFDVEGCLITIVLPIEVAVYSSLEILGLTHIDNFAIRVVIAVHTGQLGQRFQDAIYVGVRLHQK